MANQSPLLDQRTLFTTRRYGRLQGLRSVLGGVGVLLVGAFTALSISISKAIAANATNALLQPFLQMLFLFAFTAILLPAIYVADSRIKRLYQQQYGVVRPLGNGTTRIVRRLVGGLIVIMLGFLAAALTALPIAFAFALLGVYGFTLAIVDRKRFGGWDAYSLTYPASLVLASGLLWDSVPAPGVTPLVVFGCTGLGAIAGGLIDHYQLNRTLSPSTTKEANV